MAEEDTTQQDSYDSYPDERMLDEAREIVDNLKDVADKLKAGKRAELAAAAHQQETMLPSSLPTTGPSMSTATLAPPRNRTYMGPNIGGPTNPEEFFGPSLPPGTVISPPSMKNPPLVPGAAGRVAEATSQPEYDPSLTSVDPTARQFRAQQSMQQAIKGGMSSADAFLTFGQEFLPPITSPAAARAIFPRSSSSVAAVRPPTEFQRWEMENAARREAQRITPQETARNKAALMDVQAATNRKKWLQMQLTKATIARDTARQQKMPRAVDVAQVQMDQYQRELDSLAGTTAGTATNAPAAVKAPTAPAPAQTAATKPAGTPRKKIDRSKMQEYLKRSNNNVDKAIELARQDGYAV